MSTAAPASTSESTPALSKKQHNYGSTSHLHQPQHEEFKSTKNVRQAFRDRDVDASRREHQKPIDPTGEEHSSDASEYIKSVVFGGLDGIMTTFALIAAAAGSDASFSTILIFGFSNVVADGFAMGFGEYVSGSAELDHGRTEKAREEWELENNREMEIQEMIEIYQNKGLSEADAKTLVDIFSKDDKLFVDIMMHDELGLLGDYGEEGSSEPLRQGLVMFLSFMLFGSVPLLAYLVTRRGHGLDEIFGYACFLTSLALMALGAIKGYLTGISIPKSSVLMLMNGCASGAVSFLISSLVDGMVH